MQISILFISANPSDTETLRLDAEVKEINEGLKRAKQRDIFQMKTCLAATPTDIQRELLDYNPNIVHFSGHGQGEEGLWFDDGHGNRQLVSGTALAELFKLFAANIRCVLLNACYSEIQAQAIVQHIDYVIGMNQAITDQAARAFAVAFYDALGAGKDIEFAYKSGCVGLQLQNIPEHLTPVLLCKHPKIDPDVRATPSHEVNFPTFDLRKITEEQKLAIISRLDERAIPPYLIDMAIVDALIDALSVAADAHATINRANSLRQRADPDIAPQSIVIPSHALPPIGEHGIADIQTFWMAVVNKACSRGGKMLGALFLELPRQVTGPPGDEIHNEILRILESYYK